MAEDMREALFKELAARFEALKGDFKRRDNEVDGRIVRWRYAERSAFEVRADYFRRFNENPGTLVDEEPTHAYIYHAYGYDAQDRIIYSATFQSEELPRLCRFYEYADDHIDVVEYGVELYTERYSPRRVERLVQPAGQKPLYYGEYVASTGRGAQFIEDYHYDNQGRIARITSSHQSQPIPLDQKAQDRWQQAMEQQRRIARMMGTEEQFNQMFPQFEEVMRGAFQQSAAFESEEIYEYDGDTLQRIVARGANPPGGSREEVRYEAPREGETEDALFEAARASLRKAVIDQVVQFDPAQRQQMRVYNLALSYDAVADDGVLLILGQETQRQEWERETDERSYRSLIYHTLGRRSVHIELWNLPDEYARFLRDMRRAQRWGDVRKLLVQVAWDLNDHDWSGTLLTTDDFVVYANDYEAMEDVHDELRACVPEAKLAILRAKGLL